MCCHFTKVNYLLTESIFVFGSTYLLYMKITMQNEFINILQNSNGCMHSFEINDGCSPQCTGCLMLSSWSDLHKYLKRTYGDHGTIEYDLLKQRCFRARSKNKSGLVLISKKYLSIELNKDIIKNFYYEKNN